MRASLFLLAFCMLFAPAAALAKPSTFERGRAVSQLLHAGKLTEIAAQLSPAYAAEIGGERGLAKLHAKVKGRSEEKVEEERAYLTRGRVSYVRISRFGQGVSFATSVTWEPSGKIARLALQPTIKPAASSHLSYQTKTPLRLPFDAPKHGYWYVSQGGRDWLANYHVEAHDQRFAYDFVVLRGSESFSGNGTRNEDYFCWDQPIYAPAAGRIVHAIGDVADNPKPARRSGTGPGNHVVIDHGNGEFSLLAHFRQGSLAVEKGSRVAAGALVGRCGNSGSSVGPHLHFHVQNGSEYKQNVGLPAAFNGYFSGGSYVLRGEPRRGELLLPDPLSED